MAAVHVAELTCRELVELVTEYLEGTLPEPERLRFDAHLAECPYCQTYLEQMRQTIAPVGRLTEDTIDAEEGGSARALSVVEAAGLTRRDTSVGPRRERRERDPGR